MGTDEQPKKTFGMGVSKEFLVAICSVIFAAGVNYSKLNNIDSTMADLKKSIDQEQKDYQDISIAEKLLEARVLTLEQKTQSQPQQHK